MIVICPPQDYQEFCWKVKRAVNFVYFQLLIAINKNPVALSGKEQLRILWIKIPFLQLVRIWVPVKCSHWEIFIPSNINQEKLHIKIHSLMFYDIWWSTSVISTERFLYYINFVDPKTYFNWVFPLFKKSQVHDIFLKFKTVVELQIEHRILRQTVPLKFKKLAPMHHY